MSDFKVVEGADKVGAWAIKYNELVDEVIESVNTVDDGVNVIITYNKNGGGTFTSVINKSNVVTGKTYDQILSIALSGDLVVGMFYELSHKTIDSISNTNVVYTGQTETLLLLAVDEYSFHTQVYSKDYPQDIIYYDFSNNGFTLPNGTTIYRKNGYIYYRHDTVRNLKVRGYDFRNHIMYRYLVDKVNYNQYNPAATGGTGDYVWYNNKLYVYSKPVGAGTPPDSNNSILLIENDIYLTTTGSTNYGTTVKTDILLYPNLASVTSGYTFGLLYSDNNGSSVQYKNITIDSFYSYNGWRPFYDYSSTNYTHKPNIALWGSFCNNGHFSDSVTNVTLTGSTLTNFNFINVNNINLQGSFTDFNLNYVANTFLSGSFSNTELNRSNSIYIYGGIDKLDISWSSFSQIYSNSKSKISESEYSYLGPGCTENIINKFYYSKIFNASNNLLLSNVVNSVIGGSYHDVSNSTYINIGTTGTTSTYGTNTNNIIKNSNNINLYGSYNNLDNCFNLGVLNTTGSTPYLFSDYTTYKAGCENISTYLNIGQITNCSFGERSKNIRLLAWNVGLTNCTFAPGTQNINFNTPDFTTKIYTNIKTCLAYDGYKASPLRPNITITNININNENFIGLNETNQLVGLNFTGGTTPVYVSIESFQ